MHLIDELKGVALRLARRKLRLKQYELGNMLGFRAATIAQWESGRRIPCKANWRIILVLMEQRGITFDAKGFPIEDKKKVAAFALRMQ